MLSRLKNLPLERKLTTVMLFSSGAALVLAGFTFILGDIYSFHRDATIDVTNISNIVSQDLAVAIVFDDNRAAQDSLSALREDSQIITASVFTNDMTEFATYRSDVDGHDAEMIAGPFDGKVEKSNSFEGEAVCDFVRFEFSHLTSCKTILHRDEVIGKLFIQFSLSEFYSQLMYKALFILTVLLLTFFIGSFVLKRLSTTIATPILNLASLANEISSSRDYSVRAVKETDDEIGVLTDGFNHMLQEIHTQQSRLRLYNTKLESIVASRTAELSRKVDEATKANNAKSDFLSQMSHELRTPMNAILGFGQLLEMQLPEGQFRSNASHIVTGGNHLLKLINEVLDLAKIESGSIEMAEDEVSLTEIVEECLLLLRQLAESKNIDIINNVSSIENHYIKADFFRLKQVVLNLLSNAVKYNRDNGTVVLSCGEVNSGTLRLSIKDTGNGMNEAQLEKLFRPFERMGAELSDIEGTGIGLVISKSLIEMMHGDIGVESTPGLGSRFWIDMHCREKGDVIVNEIEVPDQTISVPLTETNNEDRSILYIEDNPANLLLIERIVEQHTPYIFFSAMTPTLGLEMVRKHRPDLILLDINLPEMNGYEVMERLQAEDATSDIPVIAITANAMPSEVERGKAAGFLEYVLKPIEVNGLIDVINRVMSREGVK